ncbi:hypothetical protein K239x_49290 [Planctomycetes bacterium K23_9]|uniref:Uncharacterized protein n=1 Tax=Stieleria marina TaxID=1930275 RepID=A0A517P0L1_9BACT|nr:hypothetical protein K239x_49290 [Planctomycetes bacterium K23_9]
MALSPFFMRTQNHQWQISGTPANALGLYRWLGHVAQS